MDIKNRVVVVTGSSSGIGKTIVLRFAAEGAKAVINYRINQKGAEDTLAKIKEMGWDGLLVRADVSNPKDVETLFKTVVDQFGTVDILVNNAAIPVDKVPFMEATYEDILELIKTDLIAPMICSQFAIRVMEKQGYGKILNTSSIRGAEHAGRAIVYAALKAGLNSFTKTLAKQVAPKIQVNAVAPGFVKTRSYDKISKELIDYFIGQTYLKRWITEDEIADAFIFLTKNDAITGQVVYVDGGFTLK
jgi:3-oxoacyl-[acyl-carrier protein] reductase